MKKLLVGLLTVVIGSAFAETKNITWQANGTTYATSTCEVGGDLIIPQNTPTKYGYHFVGWTSLYTFLEYIESTGTQYIDTRRVPNNDDIIEQKFQKVGTSTTTCSWYGSMPSSQTLLPRFCIGSFFYDGVLNIFAGSNFTATIGKADTNTHTLRFQATGNRELTYTFDGVTEVIEAGEGHNMYEPAVELTSYLFARHGNAGVQVYDNEGTRIYYHREYRANGTLVLNFIPARRNSDNVLGMYDTISDQFFTNQGAGEFIAGPEIQQ